MTATTSAGRPTARETFRHPVVDPCHPPVTGRALHSKSTGEPRPGTSANPLETHDFRS
jgi:hypothetical protein